MDFQQSVEDLAFRDEIRDFVAEQIGMIPATT